MLREHIKDESVDLVYLDPPFKSNQDYNVLFAEQDGTRAAAQIHAFEDTWHWDQGAALAYQEVVEKGERVSEAMQAFRTFLSESDMMAYLAMMAPRLVELKRVMKPTASIYLHCDPTASHYLKMLMDAVFGAAQFRNEIIWKRTGSHNSAIRFGPVHDSLLYYRRGSQATWNQQFQPYDASYLEKFKKVDAATGKQFQDVTLTGPGVRKGDSGQPWRGHDPTSKGRHWQPASYLYSKYREITGEDLAQYPLLKRLDKLDEVGLVYWSKRGGLPRYLQFLDDAPGSPLPDVWTDIAAINSQAAERLGYPTQKPEELLERVIVASSDEGDTVLDPFCGCGTTIAAAQELKRRWLGIDITHLAIGLLKHRLHDSYGAAIAKTFDVIGEPVVLSGAKQLAAEDPYQFQWWALGLVGARPVEQKKGADKGIDGRLFFHDEGPGGKTKQVIISVKAGKTGPTHVRDLSGVVQREKAAIGVLISMQKPTKPMRKEAASSDLYESAWGKHPRLQLLTVEELLGGKGIDMPPVGQTSQTFKKAPKAKGKGAEQLKL